MVLPKLWLVTPIPQFIYSLFSVNCQFDPVKLIKNLQHWRYRIAARIKANIDCHESKIKKEGLFLMLFIYIFHIQYYYIYTSRCE